MTTICRHIKTNGERCGSPALRSQNYCFYHRNLSRQHPPLPPDTRDPSVIHVRNPAGEATQVVLPPTPRLDLPALEDRESIQVALSVILNALARNDLDTKRATTLLYGLQVASANAARLRHDPARNYLVTETTLDETGHEIAPDEQPQAELDYQEFLRNLDEEDEKNDEEEDYEDDEEELEADGREEESDQEAA